MTSGWNEAQFGILFCEPECFFLSSVVHSSCLDFSLIITDKNVFFRFLLIVINFLIFRLVSCFRSQVPVSNYLSLPFCWFQICLSFPFRPFPCLALRFFLDRIQNLCFPSCRIRYGFQQSRRVCPGFITWLQQSEKFLDQGTVTRPPSSIYARVNWSVIRARCTRVQGHPRNLFRRPWIIGFLSLKHHT